MTTGPRGAVTLEEARTWRFELRAAGQRVAFTNGCFDLLHAGHVDLLASARASADALVVAINGDDSVRRLKGPARPLVPAAERAELLSALEYVDRVVVFDEDSPLEVILALDPDVLVKGSDWEPDAIIGAREVVAGGGEVVRVPMRPDVSTSAIIERIRQRLA